MGYVIYIVNDHERMARARDVFFSSSFFFKFLLFVSFWWVGRGFCDVSVPRIREIGRERD